METRHSRRRELAELRYRHSLHWAIYRATGDKSYAYDWTECQLREQEIVLRMVSARIGDSVREVLA